MKNLKSLVADIFIITALIFTSLSLIIFPSEAVGAAKNGVEMCLYIVIPSLFPFFVIATLSANLGFSERLGKFTGPIMQPLFRLNGNCAVPLILGLIGGYPVGTKATVELYKNGHCTKNEAERLLGFCNNSGPAFIFGIVGAYVFKSVMIGTVIYVIHILTSLIIGVLFRFTAPAGKKRKSDSVIISGKRKSITSAFIYSVTSSFSAMLNISAFVIFFAVMINILTTSGLLPIISQKLSGILFNGNSMAVKSVLSGMIEMTSGICSLSPAYSSPALIAALASFLLGWAGLSIHCQILSILGDTDLSVKYLFAGKAAHGVLSAIFTYFVCSFFTEKTFSAGAVSASAYQIYSSINGKAVLIFSVLFAVFFLLWAFSAGKKSGGNRRINNI